MTIRRRAGLILAGIAATLLVVCILVVPVLLNADRYRPEAIKSGFARSSVPGRRIIQDERIWQPTVAARSRLSQKNSYHSCR
jgi:hypothetical protein